MGVSGCLGILRLYKSGEVFKRKFMGCMLCVVGKKLWVGVFFVGVCLFWMLLLGLRWSFWTRCCGRCGCCGLCVVL